MQNNNTPINIFMLTSEERHNLFIALLDADPSLPNVLNSEQRRCLYTVLISIDSSLLPADARSAICGVANEQVKFNQHRNK